MKSDSPLFDRIRVKPDKDRRLRAQCPGCEWPNCQAPATHRAPKGRLREREYWRFCLEHVREYNHAYNFFAGMSTEDIARYQKEAVVGHRPTWKMGMSGGPPSSRSHSSRFDPEFTNVGDPFGIFREFGAAGIPGRASRRSATECRTQSARRARARGGRLRARRQSAVQDACEAASSRRQWWRPLLGGSAAGDHPGLQLSEIDRLPLTQRGRAPGAVLRAIPGTPRFRSAASSRIAPDAALP